MSAWSDLVNVILPQLEKALFLYRRSVARSVSRCGPAEPFNIPVRQLGQCRRLQSRPAKDIDA
jgi:hypothetical protein